MLIYFSQHSSYCRRASVKFTAAPFFVPLQLLLGGLLIEAEAGQPAFCPPADPPTVRTLSEMVKKLWRSSLWLSGTFRIAPSSSPHKAVWSLSWLTSWEQQTLVKSGVNHFNQHIVGLSEFHDTLSMIILRFSGNISDGHSQGEISLICHHKFSYFAFL